MLASETASPTRLARLRGRITGKRQDPGLLGRVLAFAAAAGLVLAYALPGGAYDIVIRQEYGIVVWWVVAVGVVCGLLPRRRPARVTIILIGCLGAYLAWTAVSLAWTESAERTTTEIARSLQYVGLIVLIAFVLDRSSWRAAATGLVFGALVVCCLSIASRLAPASFAYNPLVNARGTVRLIYPFGYWNAVGAWGAMSAAAGLALSSHDRSRVRRALWLGLVPLALLLPYLAYSRAAIAGTGLGVILVLVLSRHRLTAFVHVLAAAAGGAIEILVVRAEPAIANGTGTAGAGPVLAAVLVAVVMCAAAGALTAALGLDRFGVRLPTAARKAVITASAVCLVALVAAFAIVVVPSAWRQFQHPVVTTTADPASRLTQLSGYRYNVWRSALDAFSAHPFSGTGAGTFEFWLDRHPRDSEFVRNAHSFELENLAELGGLGLLLILAVVAAALAVPIVVRRRIRSAASVGASAALLAVLAVFVLQASVDWLWQVTALTVLALVAAAVAGARLSVPALRIRWPGRIALALAAVCAGLVQAPGLLSTTEIRRSQAAERSGNGTAALSWANAAVTAEPWAASPYEQRGLVYEAAGLLSPADADLRRAVSREPTNFRHWLLLARIENERGNGAAASRDYARARQLRPEAIPFLVG